jgi:Phage gp6-like head-tail connector protein
MITTLSKVKTTLNLNGNDQQISELIPLVEEWMEGYCNDDFSIYGYPKGYEKIAINLVGYDLNRKYGIKSESLSRYSVTYEEDYPPALLKGLKRKLRW